MRAILIDDEYLALAYLNDLLAETGEMVIEGTYQDPKRALKEMEEIAPDVVFLDIDMPEMTGIELAERIQSSLPATQIVFITAYDHYAVKAFELNAIDYLLKPVEVERLTATLERLAEKAAMTAQAKKQASIPHDSLLPEPAYRVRKSVAESPPVANVQSPRTVRLFAASPGTAGSQRNSS
ncbi:LytTR family DNA-binding domain-containing protein [Paenibacillus thiaminolyticus]|nr:response regulator [Paenibacillus thiaminolyticus]